MSLWPDGKEEYDDWMRSLEKDDPDAWHEGECKICGEPDCEGDCWLSAPWLDDEELGDEI